MTKYLSLFPSELTVGTAPGSTAPQQAKKTTPKNSKIARCPWGRKWGLKMGIRCAVEISGVCDSLRHVHHLHTCLAEACQVIPERTYQQRYTATHQISTHFYVTHTYLCNKKVDHLLFYHSEHPVRTIYSVKWSVSKHLRSPLDFDKILYVIKSNILLEGLVKVHTFLCF